MRKTLAYWLIWGAVYFVCAGQTTPTPTPIPTELHGGSYILRQGNYTFSTLPNAQVVTGVCESATASPTLSPTPTASATPTSSASASPSPTPTPTSLPTITPSPTPTPVGSCAAIATVGQVITDQQGHTWTINTSAKVVINGVVDTRTGNVTKLVYMPPNMWQLAPYAGADRWWYMATQNASATGTWVSSASAPACLAPTPTPTATAVAHFSTLAPKAALPTAQYCAAQVNAVPMPEVVPNNVAFNGAAVIPTAAQLSPFKLNPQPFKGDTQGNSYYATADGNFSGSTDMLIRNAACKWGIDEDVVRAQVMNESGWLSKAAGDQRTTTGECIQPNYPQLTIWNTIVQQPGGFTVSCPNCCYQSWQASQNKLFFEPTAWPMAVNSTAFALDLTYAKTRVCMDGLDSIYFSSASQQPNTYATDIATGSVARVLWGCVGMHFSGGWYDPGAQTYINQVQAHLAARDWP